MAGVVFLMGLLFDQLAEAKNKSYEQLHKTVEPALLRQQRFKRDYDDLKKTQEQISQVSGWMSDRYYWVDILKELRQALIRVEAATKAGLGTDAGIWIESFNTFTPGIDTTVLTGADGAPVPNQAADNAAAAAAFARRYGLRLPGRALQPTEPSAAPEGASAKPRDLNEISSIDVTFRAVSLTSFSMDANKTVKADANQVMAFAVEAELQSSPMFDPTNTKLSSIIGQIEEPGTFTFKMTLQLKRPLKL
jgi:hypothetical protein